MRARLYCVSWLLLLLLVCRQVALLRPGGQERHVATMIDALFSYPLLLLVYFVSEPLCALGGAIYHPRDFKRLDRGLDGNAHVY